MNATTLNLADDSKSLAPAFLKPYLNAIQNIGEFAENITGAAAELSAAANDAAKLSRAMIQSRLDEVEAQQSPRPILT